MAVCHHYRIPHSQLLAWDPDDRAKAIAWHIRQAEQCPECGTRRDEWVGPDGRRKPAYQAVEHICHGCAEVEAKQGSLGPAEQAKGMRVMLKPNNQGGEVTGGAAS